MSEATITIPDELRKELERYLDRHSTPPSLSAVVEADLREYLERHEAPEVREYRPFRITPAKVGSGFSDVSVNHDAYSADDAYEDAFSIFREQS